MNHISPDEWLDRAFRLGYFLHGERDTAVQIVARAQNKLQLAASSQGKRLYYRLTGRGESRKSRSKVSLSHPHLLQRLIYVESEPYEIEKEAGLRNESPVNGRHARRSDLVIYFVKHLVRITTRRNSFYVTLGLSRLLYNYTTPETMELYNLVIQDPDRVHDDYYYRSRKGVLLKELKERFGELLEITKGTRGEQRWRSGEQDAEHNGLVRECLQWFTPWSTPCVVPENFDPFSDPIDKLNFDGRLPDEEHEVEVNRIHAALHPECFARLAAANNLATPDERLELPHFQFTGDDHDGDDFSSRTPPSISDGERRAINELLSQEAARRKAASAGLFRVLVDGRERAEIDSRNSLSTEFSVDDSAEVVEVYGSDKQGELLLATHMLDLARLESQTKDITLEGGQRFSFTTNRHGEELDGLKSARITVSYQESAPQIMAAASQALAGFAGAARDYFLAPSSWWKPVGALAALALLTAGFWVAWSRLDRSSPIQFATVRPTPSPSEIQVLPTLPPTAPENASIPEPRKQPGVIEDEIRAPRVAKNSATAPPEADETFVARTIVPDMSPAVSEAEASRGWDPAVMGKPLNEVRQVFVQTTAETTDSNDLMTRLREKLDAGQGLRSSESDQADAALKISVRPASTRPDEKRVVAIVRAVNANGYVVWPASKRGSSWRYVGSPDYVARRIVSDFKRDIERSRAR